jgi:hypothetical protein
MQNTSTLGFSTLGSCTLAAPSHPQERTKGGDTAPTVPAYGTVTAKSTRAVTAQATTAIVWHTLHPKITSRSWAAGWTTGGHHSFNSGRTRKNPCNRRIRKGVTGGGAPDKGHNGSLDH